MLDKLKQKILIQFPEYNKTYRACDLFNLIQLHINNHGLEGEELAKIIILYLDQDNFLQFTRHIFTADTFKLKNGGKR